VISKLLKKSSKSNVEEKKKFAVRLGKRVRKIREEKGWSQEELAHKAGFYRTYIGHIETGRKSPSAYTVWRIAKALEVIVTDIL